MVIKVLNFDLKHLNNFIDKISIKSKFKCFKIEILAQGGDIIGYCNYNRIC